jgi:hypothetical protein
MLKRLLPDIAWSDWFTLDRRQVDWRRTGLLIGLILALAAALWQYAMPTVRTITEREFKRVPEIRKVRDVQRVYIACPEQGIQVLDKADVAKKLDISWLQGGDIAAALAAGEELKPEVTAPSPEGTSLPADVQITATADLPESDNGYEEVSVIDTKTGASQIMAREKAAPWFQLRNDAAIGIRYGLCAGPGQITPYCGDVYGKWDFLRVKDAYLGASGALGTDSSARLQLGLEYRW